MTPGELRASVRARRAALRQAWRAKAAQARREARQSLDRHPRVAAARRRRARRLRLVGLLFLMVLLLLLRCDCGPAVDAEAPRQAVRVPPPAPTSTPGASPEARRPRPGRTPGPPQPIEGVALRLPRADFALEQATGPAWVEAFRLQVGARAPRLAACVQGATRPTALRWTASVNPENGAVSDQALEAVGDADELPPAARECLLGVLASPPYRLAPELAFDLPQRIGLVVEF